MPINANIRIKAIMLQLYTIFVFQTMFWCISYLKVWSSKIIKHGFKKQNKKTCIHLFHLHLHLYLCLLERWDITHDLSSLNSLKGLESLPLTGSFLVLSSHRFLCLHTRLCNAEGLSTWPYSHQTQ